MRTVPIVTIRTRRWSALFAVVMLAIASLACNLINQPAAVETPTLSAVNTIPPTRTLPPTGQMPTALPNFPQQSTQVVLQPTTIQIQPTSLVLPTAVPFYTATSFPTRIPTSTSLPSANIVIYSPVNNNVLAGIVQILGSAAHPFFVQAQLEFSPDPGDLWALLPGSITTSPVQTGLLGLWDTRQTPDGVYQLRLRVFTSDGGSTAAIVRNLRISNQTATLPPTATHTATATATYTASPIPTSTPLPSATATLFPTVTASSTALPSATPIATVANTEVMASSTPAPSPTLPTADLNAIPVIPVFSPGMIANLRSVYDVGVNTFGNSPYHFIKVGDDNTSASAFLTGFGDGEYNLDSFAGLEGVISFFGQETRNENGISRNSFNANSVAAVAGWTAETPLQPNSNPVQSCQPNEPPLNCELRLGRPSIALIMFGTNDVVWFTNSPDVFSGNLQAIVTQCLSNGTIPVLSTIPERLDNLVPTETILRFNTIIVDVANAYSIPLWNLWSAIRDLPNSGVSDGGVLLSSPPEGALLPTDLSMSGLAYGFNQRNLSALQVLDAVRNAVFPEVALPQPTTEPTTVAVAPSNTPVELPTITPLPTLTATWTLEPSQVPTETPLPSATPEPSATLEPPTEIPSETPTETPLPTEIPTETPAPTETPTEPPFPTESPTPTEIPTEVPPAEPTVDVNLVTILPDFVLEPELANNVRNLFATGETLGLRSNLVAFAGGTLPTDPGFLDDLGNGLVQWDTYQFDLEPTLLLFLPAEGSQNMFTRTSLAANSAWQSANLLQPELADPGLCQSGETPLACELRSTQAAYLLLSVGRQDSDMQQFRQNLELAINTSINAGVIPILATIPGTPETTGPQNTIIIELGQAYNIPVWNLWLLLRDLQNFGIVQDGTLTSSGAGQSAIFTPDYLVYGANQANLSFLQLLKTLTDTVSN